MKAKRLLSIVLLTAMLLSIAPLAVFAVETHTHTMSEECSSEGETVEFLPYDYATSSRYITEDTNYYLTADVEFNSSTCFFITEGVTLNLCLNGYSVTTLDIYYAFFVYGGGTLNICNCGDSDCCIASIRHYTVYANEGANVNLYGITVKGKNGVYACDNTALSVYGCKFTEITEYGIYSVGAKAHIERTVMCDMNLEQSAIFMNSGELYAEDCEIYDNGGKYAALYVNRTATVRIKNTDIHNNESTNGGSITSYGTLTLEGCNVYANKSTSYGGAFYLGEGDFSLIDTAVYGNTSPSNPLYVNNTVYLSGSVVIKDNVINGSYDEDLGIYVGGETKNITPNYGDPRLVVNGELSEDSEIRIGGSVYENRDYVVCDGTNVTTLEGFEKHFFFDEEAFPVVQNGAIRGLMMVQSAPSSASPEFVFKSSETVLEFAEGATYTWYKNGELLTDETGSSIAPELNGKYTLTVTLANGAHRSYSFDATPSIVSNPTVDNPAFDVNMPNFVNKYEWYATKLEQINITDSNASNVCTNCEGNYTSSYNAESSLWTGAKICDAENGCEMFYFTVDLAEGERLYIAATPEASEVKIFDYENTQGFTPSYSMIGNVQVFMADYDGSYTVSAVVPREDVQIAAYKVEITDDVLLENETAHGLSAVQVGWLYKCVATYEDGTSLTSQRLAAYPEAVSQPDYKDPTFNVTFEADAKFQWYELDENGNSVIIKGETEKTLSSLEYGKEYYCLASFPYGMNVESDTVSAVPEIVSQPTSKDPTFNVDYEEGARFEWFEIITESITDTDVDSAEGSYDSNLDLWTGLNVYEYDSDYEINWFTIELNKDDTVIVTFENPADISYYDEFGFDSSNANYYASNNNGIYIFTAPETDTYYLWSYSYSDAPKASFKLMSTSETAIEGESGKTLVNAEYGKTYQATATYENGTVLRSNIVTIAPEIITQPTIDSPTVEVNFKDKVVSYQWYELISDRITVTDENASPSYWSDSIGPIGYYDSENGYWVPTLYDTYEDNDGETYYEYDIIELELKAGDKFVLIPSAELIDKIIRLWNKDTNIGYSDDWTYESGVYMREITEDGTYYCYAYTYDESITFKAYVLTNYTIEAIAGQTTETLTAGKGDYVCLITYEDGTVLQSDMLLIDYAITKQPTADDLSVEVNFPDDVKSYEWFYVTIGEVPVTDENATAAYFNGSSMTEGYYDSENGCWVPSLYSTSTDEEGVTYYEYDIFNMELKAGDTLVIIPSAELKYGNFVTGNEDTDNDFTNDWVNEDGVYTLEITEDGMYWFYTYTYTEDITFEAYTLGEILSDAIEGEDTNTLQNFEYDVTYVCAVTFKDGTVVYSDELVIEEPEYILGDVNADGAIDQYDYILVIRHYFGTRYLTDTEMLPADVNCDGVVDQYDYILIRRHYFGTYVIG